MNCSQTQLSRHRFLTDSWPSFSCQDGSTLLADVGFQSFPAPPENESIKYDTVTSSDEVLKPEESSRMIHSIRPRNKELYSLCASRLMQYFCGQSDVDSEVILPVSSRYPSVKNTSPFVHVHHVYGVSTLAFVVVCEVLSDLDMIESEIDLTADAESRIGLQISQEASLAIESKGVQESI
ncbi:MAG TPA: hypothetical protein ENN73_03725, partial [Firmicutes bacterium]|nr:hypothetical protein [Bacillota bacterium]